MRTLRARDWAFSACMAALLFMLLAFPALTPPQPAPDAAVPVPADACTLEMLPATLDAPPTLAVQTRGGDPVPAWAFTGPLPERCAVNLPGEGGDAP